VRLAGFPDTDLMLPENAFVLRGLVLLEGLVNHNGFSIDSFSNGVLKVKKGNLALLLKTWEEIFIAHEVFFNLEYDFRLGEQTRVVDIGGNTGIASLYFASREDIAEVVSYELFEDTAVRFRENLALNPELARKIDLRVVGLGDSAADLELDYCADVKGSVGLHGIAGHAMDGKATVVKRKVRVESAATELQAILERQPAMPLVAKIDCEGAEYQIMAVLEKMNLLAKIDAFLIEWHEKGPEEIQNRLIAAGHGVWLRTHPGANHGMIYSCRRAGRA
jgi:FkbM family methyltransferase